MNEHTAENDAPFHCGYAPPGQDRCPAWRCDCFVDLYPDSPFDLHPDAFRVTSPEVEDQS